MWEIITTDNPICVPFISTLVLTTTDRAKERRQLGERDRTDFFHVQGIE